jgi:Integrase zinc binding domain
MHKGMNNPRVIDSFNGHADPHPHIEGDRIFLQHVQQGYKDNLLFKKVIKSPRHYKNFEIDEDLIYTHNLAKDHVQCIPAIVHNKWHLTEIILSQAYQVLGHLGPQKTSEYVCHYYWWPRIVQNTKLYCRMCPICQTTKSSM